MQQSLLALKGEVPAPALEEQALTRMRLEQAFARLTPRQRELCWKATEYKTVTEIAEAAGVSRTAVYQAFDRARRPLRRALRPRR